MSWAVECRWPPEARIGKELDSPLGAPERGLPWWLSQHSVCLQRRRPRFSLPGSGRSPGEEMATLSSTLAWKIPWMGEPGRLQSMGSQKVRYSWVTSLSLQTMVEVMKIMATFFKRSTACTAILVAPNPEVGHHGPTPQYLTTTVFFHH